MEKYSVLFCVAVGNDGETKRNRIQAPSDIVNGLGVGAYTIRNGIIQHAPYSCVGPGREGNKLKPDLSAFGGCDHTPIHLVSVFPGIKLLSIGGTSFSSPYASAVAGQLIGRTIGNMDTIAARALIIHKCKTVDGKHSVHLGHGTIPEDIEDITTCEPDSYTLIYQGELLPGKYAELEIPWINEPKIKGKVVFKWTLVAMSVVDPSRSDDYTEGALSLTFYPNSSKFIFENPTSGQTKSVDVVKDPGLASELENSGWKKHRFPKSEVGPTPFADEDALRNNMKWDTVENRYKTKRSGLDVKKPFFHLHALTRGNGDQTKKIKYALALTVVTPGSNVDVYSDVLQEYHALTTLNLVARNEIRVRQ